MNTYFNIEFSCGILKQAVTPVIKALIQKQGIGATVNKNMMQKLAS
jgi:hypothetical protein